MDFPNNVFISKTEFEDINLLMHFIKEIQRKLVAQHWSFHIRTSIAGHQMMMCSLEQLIQAIVLQYDDISKDEWLQQ